MPPALPFAENHAALLRRRDCLRYGAASLAALATAASRAGSLQETADPKWWDAALTTPGKAPYNLKQWQNRTLLINFWATWCPPCVEELPLLDTFSQRVSAAPHNWKVLGIAVDTHPNVKRFLAHTSVSFDIAVAGSAGLGISQQLGNKARGVPYTVLVSPSGRIVRAISGILTQKLLDKLLTLDASA